ncbi:MAG TPA: LysM peptidoglycan-binding domain-containing protein [Candidatus Cloacimonas sp.]|jgi:murein DD-endopeptidase MepM/ murein hydrolase activator NlpD|nr:LysM peptidoglycan-binding domain-containing protein [Candidatus Cloacimonas sp.]HNS84093.1 LysM peptidoglycan-binding domain-containing protein [Candidatus Cloacimonas sp.]HQM03078.1 LysM peptidoglycan-binding domain-containing protein [Candidatus Cloacimonas sp.]
MTLKLDRLLWLLVMQILLILPLGLSAEDQIHIIKKGDTLYSLSKRYGTTVDELKRLNNLSDNNLSIGQKLIVKKDVKPSKPIVPVPVTKPATPEITESSSSPQISALPGSEINPSLSLEKKIPADYYYTVKAGDNLYRIAINHNIKLEELLAWNNFANSSIPIHPGDKLVIKNPAELPETKIVPEEVISEPNPAVATVPAKNDTVLIERVYVVQKKDTLYRIATNNGMTVEELMQLNNLTSPDLKVGQKLYLSGKPRPEPLPSPTAILTEEELMKRDKIRDDLIMPVEGKVISEYGLRNGRPHKGIDLGAKAGTPIYAVLDGTVVYAGIQGSYGNVIVIEHPDFVMTVYAHNEKNMVNVNDVVKQGQQIATVGATGNAQGTHLHFEYRLKGKAINPRKVLPLP